jgi:branched-chain amino acid transport system ATP-binding protein
MRVEFDLTILLIEHNVRLVMALADQVTVLNHGTVIASGPPDHVIADPDVVKAYLGERWQGTASGPHA